MRSNIGEVASQCQDRLFEGPVLAHKVTHQPVHGVIAMGVAWGWPRGRRIKRSMHCGAGVARWLCAAPQFAADVFGEKTRDLGHGEYADLMHGPSGPESCSLHAGFAVNTWVRCFPFVGLTRWQMLYSDLNPQCSSGIVFPVARVTFEWSAWILQCRQQEFKSRFV